MSVSNLKLIGQYYSYIETEIFDPLPAQPPLLSLAYLSAYRATQAAVPRQGTPRRAVAGRSCHIHGHTYLQTKSSPTQYSYV